MPRLLCVDTSAELIDASAQHRVFVRPAEPSPDLALTQSSQVASGQVEQASQVASGQVEQSSQVASGQVEQSA